MKETQKEYMKEMMSQEDHFEYESEVNNFSFGDLDISAVAGDAAGASGMPSPSGVASAANNVLATGQKLQNEITAPLAAIGKVFGIGKEDTSTTGFNAYGKAHPPLPWYPTLDEMIAAAKDGRWASAEIPALQATYNQSTGVWNMGDWYHRVIGVAPITAKSFKGASESYPFPSTIYAKPPSTPIFGGSSTSSGGSTVSNGVTSNAGADLTSAIAGMNLNPWYILAALVVVAVIIYFTAK